MFSQVFVCPQGVLCTGVSAQGDHPYSKERAISILLEWILVRIFLQLSDFWQCEISNLYSSFHFLSTFESEDKDMFVEHVYYRPYFRYGPYLVGLGCADIYMWTKDKVKNKKDTWWKVFSYRYISNIPFWQLIFTRYIFFHLPFTDFCPSDVGCRHSNES